MAKNKKINRFDQLTDNLTKEFLKIPNFNLVLENELANKVFNMTSFRMMEIISYKELVCNSFIPAVNKSIYIGKNEVRNSRHKNLIDIKSFDFEETLFDTIRLAYVGLFHKLENYINEVETIINLIFQKEVFETEVTVSEWAKERFQFNLKDWRQFYITSKINWICNCVKHRDGYPTKDPKPVGFQAIDESLRIRIKVDEFKKDCDMLIDLYPHYLSIMTSIAKHKMFYEMTLKNTNTEVEYLNNVIALESLIKGQLKILKD
ncbi:hypothetical protein IR083_10660 [Dysgonomonas sp. GY75]|uniref:hypothetical protein n=1 Tax=Dysgonomonas sp. GY75 TaxID=2780419 RepID=UPI0018835A92|nr:hypothetical protein [Dysgonomonas sp. GY75]MBF0649282.1 hypothetical protein [Dysgonomonas sp. GY75]